MSLGLLGSVGETLGHAVFRPPLFRWARGWRGPRRQKAKTFLEKSQEKASLCQKKLHSNHMLREEWRVLLGLLKVR